MRERDVCVCMDMHGLQVLCYIVLAASGVMAASSGAPAASAGPAADDEAIEFSYFMVSDKLLQYACPSGGRK